jgi:hypothetical protein
MNRRIPYLISLFIIAAATLALPQADYKAEPTGACELPEVSAAVKDALQPEGLRVTGAKGVVFEMWLRKLIPQKAGSSGTSYGTIADGTFVGILKYNEDGGDFRGQTLKPGTYTMRYQTMPSDGNHMGCSPSPEFVLLSLASEDTDPNAVVSYQTLIKNSREASGASHPAVLYLTIPEGADKPAFHPAEEDDWALEARTKAQPAGGSAETDFPIAVILIGKAEG